MHATLPQNIGSIKDCTLDIYANFKAFLVSFDGISHMMHLGKLKRWIGCTGAGCWSGTVTTCEIQQREE
uniref:Uncharacterized protein n=1 Tax=Arundo donax TaxID=35708 RepID=A0A0A9TT74_ARUDO